MIASIFVMNQYEYSPHVTVGSDDIFIDGGGYYGDTAYWAYTKKAKQIYSFEPSPSTREALQKNIGLIGADNIKIVPLGLGEKTGTGTFLVSDNPGSSRIVSSTKNKKANTLDIQIIDLDTWCGQHDITPTFIKLDVEGASYKRCGERGKQLALSNPSLQ